jgi:hypothetical protein
MATLEVDPRQLVTLAANLAVVVGRVQGLVPADTVRAAGGDPISTAGAQRLSSQGAQLANLINEGLNKLAAAAYAIGAAGQQYSRTDIAGGRAIASTELGANSAPAGEITNPVGPWAAIPRRDVPKVSTGVPAGGYPDPEDFARELLQGDSGQSAINFSGSWRDVYAAAAHPMTDIAVVETANGVRQWKPVGADVATLFEQFRRWQDEVGRNYAAMLAQQADVYVGAFDDVRNAHPPLETILEAKRRYQTAMPGPEKTAALVHLMQVYQQSWQAQQQYRTAIESAIPNRDIVVAPPDIAGPTIAAVDNDIGSRQADRGTGTGSGGNQTRNGNAISDILRGVTSGLPLLTQLLGATGDTTLPDAGPIGAPTVPPTVPPPTPTPTPTPGIEQPANSDAIPQIPDLSQLANQGLNDGPPSDEGLLEDPYLENADPLDDFDLDPGGYGGGYGGGLGGGGGVPTSAVGGVPLFGATSLRAPQTPGARQFGGPAAGGRSQAGVGGMPYMPYMPGMGGGNPNAGDRKNPFAVEQKIVDDDDLRSQVLASATVNEKPPVLPPDATRPTPDNTARNQAGATA